MFSLVSEWDWGLVSFPAIAMLLQSETGPWGVELEGQGGVVVVVVCCHRLLWSPRSRGNVAVP